MKRLTHLLVLLGIQNMIAQVIPIPTTKVTASTEIPAPFDRQDDYLVDGSGLVDGAHTPTVQPNMWLSAANGFGSEDLDPHVIFDLGAVYTITSIHVWNYNESPPNLTNRGVNAVTIEYGETAALGSTVPGITNFAQADGLATYTGEVFNSFPPFQAQFIKFDIDTNHGDGNLFYGLSEVQFTGFSEGIGISQDTFPNSAVQGDPVGNLISAGMIPGDTLTYTLVAGDGDTDNAKFQISGDELQIGTHDFSTATEGQEFFVRVRSVGSPSGATAEQDLVLTVFVPDLTPPSIVSLSPANTSQVVRPFDDFVAVFDEALVAGTGEVTIKNLTDATEIVLPLTDPQVVISDTVFGINLTNPLLPEKDYAIHLPDTALLDGAGNSFAGVSDDDIWSFSVPAAVPITLVGFWPFDEDSTVQPDLSGFANDASVGTGATWIDDAERNGVMEFDGNDAFLEAADSESLSLTSDMTIAAWINVTDFATFRGILGKTAGTLGNFPASYDLYLLANGGQPRFLTGRPTQASQVTATTVPVTGEWHHIAVTRIGDDVSFYYDGQLNGQGIQTALRVDFDTALRIGNRADLVTDFLGRLDDVALFDGGLSQSQIMSIMDGDFSEFISRRGSGLAITSIVTADNPVTSATITFNSVPGRSYTLQYSTTLEADSWIEVDDNVPSQGSSTTYIDTFAISFGPKIFYRVIQN